MKETFVSRIESKPLAVEKSDPKPKAGPKKVSDDIFKMETDEEIYDYQFNILKSIGISNPTHFSGSFFKRSDVADKNNFWNNFLRTLNVKAAGKVQSLAGVRGTRSNVLPGFTGNLKDRDIKAELNAIFEGHAEEIITGNHCLALRSYNALLKTFRRIYHRSKDKSVKGFILILLSTMKDCVITERSDTWYSDCLLSAIDALEEDDYQVAGDTSPPAPAENVLLNYKVVTPYD